MSDLFVSWAGRHAHDVGELIRSLFDSHRDIFQVFLSSRDIEAGTQWQDKLLDNLRSAGDAVVIFSQEAIKSDWLIHETAVLSSRTKRLTIFLLGAPAEILPEPLRRFQYRHLDRAALEPWLDDIIETRKLSVSVGQRDAFLRKVERIIADYAASHVAPTEHKWEGSFSRPVAISKQNDSPFEVSELIRIARRRLILVAQNHGFMTDPEGARDKIAALLFEKLAFGLTVDIVAMHPRIPALAGDPCAVWANYMGAQHFHAHVNRCWDTLSSWDKTFKSRREAESLSGRLRIKGAYLLPVSVNIVDPEDSDGFLVISPRLAQEANAERPQFLVTKRYEPAIFNFYWGTIRNSFDNSGWIAIEKLASLP